MKKILVIVFVFLFVMLCGCNPVTDTPVVTDPIGEGTTVSGTPVIEDDDDGWELPIDVDDSVTEPVTDNPETTEGEDNTEPSTSNTEVQDPTDTKPTEGDAQDPTEEEDTTEPTEATEDVTNPTDPEPTETIPVTTSGNSDGPIELPMIPG